MSVALMVSVDDPGDRQVNITLAMVVLSNVPIAGDCVHSYVSGSPSGSEPVALRVITPCNAADIGVAITALTIGQLSKVPATDNVPAPGPLH